MLWCKNKVMESAIVFSVTIQSIASIIHLYVMIFHFNYTWFIDYSPTLMISLYGIAASLTVLAIKTRLKRTHDLLPILFQELPRSGQQGREFAAYAKNARIVTKTICTMCLIALLAHLPILEEENQLFFAMFMLKKYYGDKNLFIRIFSVIYYLSFGPLAFMMVVQSFHVLYFFTHTVFQMRLLIHHLMILTGKYSNGEELYDNTKYQNMVEKRMKFVVKYHQQLKTFIKFGTDMMYVPNIVHVVMGILFCTAVIFSIATKFSWNMIPRLATLATVDIMVVIVYLHNGQMLTDYSVLVFQNVQNLSWSCWNEKNKTTLLLYMMNCINPIAVSTSEIVTLNYRLFLTLAKFLISLFTLFRKILI